MQVFHCDCCQNIVYIENAVCLGCDSPLAFLPDLRVMSALLKQDDGTYLATASGDPPRRYRLCQNDVEHGICNWAVPVEDPQPLCVSCRLTSVIPDLDIAGNLSAWKRMEQVKRRLLYNLMQLNLPFASLQEDPVNGLSFAFLADAQQGSAPVLTGHLNGSVTINIAEADDEERERRRLNLREPYRTLLGHFRHEIGHYYWRPFIVDGGRLEAFRALFGDETLDYGSALASYYSQGAPSDWQSRHVSSYASSHPLEDWAETCAHYFHIFHTLDSASHCGLQLLPARQDEPHLDLGGQGQPVDWSDFDGLIQRWIPLTYLLNSLTRSLGQNDAYPFVLSATAIEKLRFVHNCLPGRAA